MEKKDFIKLLNIQLMNKKMLQPDKMIYEPFIGDIVKVCYVPMNDPYLPGNTAYPHDMPDTNEELIETAQNNLEFSDFSVLGMSEILPFLDPEKEVLYVATSRTQFGASVIASKTALKKISDDVFDGGDFIIIPSSIYEVILLAPSAKATSGLGDIIKAVNGTIDPKIVLSEKPIYYYSGIEKLEEIEEE